MANKTHQQSFAGVRDDVDLSSKVLSRQCTRCPSSPAKSSKGLKLLTMHQRGMNDEGKM
jgi:hypothetical protein